MAAEAVAVAALAAEAAEEWAEVAEAASAAVATEALADPCSADLCLAAGDTDVVTAITEEAPDSTEVAVWADFWAC